MKLFAVYDKKAAAFGTPYTSQNDGTACRSFERACKDPSLEIHQFPDDYQLFALGDFDTESGAIGTHGYPCFIANGSAFTAV